MKRWIIYAIVASVVFLAGASLAFIAYVAPSGTGYQAKILCSGVFVSGRDPQTILREEFAGLHPLMALIDTEIDREAGEVRAALLGLGTRRAFWRDGLGCTLARPDGYLAPVALPPKLQGAGPKSSPTWPSNPVRDLSGVNEARLDEALDEAFAEPDPDHPHHTRAVVVLKGGTLVAERYAQGLSRDTPLAGWSMSKTITGALVGILVGQGRLDLHAPAPVPEWHSPGDSRRRITLEQLLHMSSVLAFDESEGPLSDLAMMLYRSPDMAAYAAPNRSRTRPEVCGPIPAARPISCRG
jgi:Beta-lactamase